jgi:putative membrane protein
MFYNNYYWGMNPIWWILWVLFLLWIFATPYDFPGQRKRKDSALQILRNRFANGQITVKEYEEAKRLLLKESSK